jgi:hypothetical protein
VTSHLRCIGFDAKDHNAVEALLRRTAAQATLLPCDRGTYLRWTCESGAELWLQVSPSREIIGAQPHFGGDAAFRVAVTQAITRPDESELDGAFHCWANLASDDPEDRKFPFVFDAPDFHLHSSRLAVPAEATVQLVGFGQDVRVFESVTAYEAHQVREASGTVESFSPAGLLHPNGGVTSPPTAHAILAGRILRSARRRNRLTGRAFYWAKVQTYGGCLDAVLAPESVPGGLPVGAVLRGTFWLSGRLAGYPQPRSHSAGTRSWTGRRSPFFASGRPPSRASSPDFISPSRYPPSRRCPSRPRPS